MNLNPHQVDAALFALHSPLPKGAVLADEVGLSKTIEAGIVIGQRWAERRRRVPVRRPLIAWRGITECWQIPLSQYCPNPAVTKGDAAARMSMLNSSASLANTATYRQFAYSDAGVRHPPRIFLPSPFCAPGAEVSARGASAAYGGGNQLCTGTRTWPARTLARRAACTYEVLLMT